MKKLILLNNLLLTCLVVGCEESKKVQIKEKHIVTCYEGNISLSSQNKKNPIKIEKENSIVLKGNFKNVIINGDQVDFDSSPKEYSVSCKKVEM